jgi:putative transposase
LPDPGDNALAETVIGLLETEVIRRRGPWRGIEAVELATLGWVDWLDHRRLLEPIGFVPPAEAEAAFYCTGAFGGFSLSRICAALLVQVKGLGSSLCSSM